MFPPLTAAFPSKDAALGPSVPHAAGPQESARKIFRAARDASAHVRLTAASGPDIGPRRAADQNSSAYARFAYREAAPQRVRRRGAAFFV